MLTPPEVSLLRLLKKTAIVLLLLLKLDRPAGESEAAEILEIDRTTARKYLQSLADLGIIARFHPHHGYLLTDDGRQMLLGQFAEDPSPEPQMGKIPPESGKISANGSLKKNLIVVVNSQIKQKDDLTTTREPNGENFPNSDAKKLGAAQASKLGAAQSSKLCEAQSSMVSPEEPLPEMTFGVRQAFWEVGIHRNQRTLRLATRDYITPEYIRAHYQALKQAGVDREKITGVLIKILESGEPAPKLNRNGHLADCDCADCRRLYFLRCPDCHQDPCVCQVDEGEDDEFEDESPEDAGDETNQAETTALEVQNV